jgi:8-oxo-dGTP pyrophosphatase MutT (NUDIX family)
LWLVPREEFFHDPAAPIAQLVTPSVFAAVLDGLGRLLLVRRLDNGNWELPGGQVDVGDTARSALQREVAEEAGVTIEAVDVSGVYTDPGYVIRSPNGRVRQPFTVCFRAALTPGSPHAASRPCRDKRRGLDRARPARHAPRTPRDAPLDRRRTCLSRSLRPTGATGVSRAGRTSPRATCGHDRR